MSEEILKALMQLFAIIALQNTGDTDNERNYVKEFLHKTVPPKDVEEYIKLFDEKIIESKQRTAKRANKKLTSMTDSVRILKICKRINKTLDYKQKIIATIRLLEMVSSQNMEKQQMEIINTVSDVFNIDGNEFNQITNLIIPNTETKSSTDCVLIINSEQTSSKNHILSKGLDGQIVILNIISANLFIARYSGTQELLLNGLPMIVDQCHIFSPGSTIKPPTDKPIYFSDVYEGFHSDSKLLKISYIAKDITYKFDNGIYGLQNMTIEEQQNTLIAIMGASGSGKSTLLNVLAGNLKPFNGSISINGLDLHDEKDQLEGVIGFIPQDDLLIENLTVYENLYFNSLFCFADKSKKWINDSINKTLKSLELYTIKDLQVGSPMNKLISGGQRKRLNIALELIREPSILFVDEPTSGLSSRDSENVMDLLRELSLKGKLIFVVIHQPASDIYKIFDKVIMLDEGGYMIQNGNPVDIISYFKKKDGQASHANAQCPSCGNVNPEQIFTIVHSEIVDEYGNYNNVRKKTPKIWYKFYNEAKNESNVKEEKLPPPKNIGIPSKLKQAWIYFQRDYTSKLRNKVYLIIAIFEAPILALILTTVIRYIPAGDNYIFRLNENLPQYIFMSIIVAMFMGLTISAEEIFRDKKILKREAFLNLSKTSYLLSKISILMIISILQAILFVGVGNYIFGIHGMLFSYWLSFFSVAFFSNILGLIISSSFNEVVTIYIMIPLLIIPQMVLGGAMFSFDKMNKDIVRIDKVPFIADMMVTKWAYEGLMVYQFKHNKFEKHFYQLEKKESESDFYQVYYIPELQKELKLVNKLFNSKTNNLKFHNGSQLLINEYNKKTINYPQLANKTLNINSTSQISSKYLKIYSNYINELEKIYAHEFQIANTALNRKIDGYLNKQKNKYYNLRNKYQNEAVSDIVTQFYEKHKILNYNNHLIPHINAIYFDPIVESKFDISAHLFAPRKHFMGKFYETFNFNMSIIWIINIFMFFILRFNVLRRIIEFKLPKRKQTF